MCLNMQIKMGKLLIVGTRNFTYEVKHETKQDGKLFVLLGKRKEMKHD